MRPVIKITLAFTLLLLVAWIFTWGVSVNNAVSYYPEGIAEGEGEGVTLQCRTLLLTTGAWVL